MNNLVNKMARLTVYLPDELKKRVETKFGKLHWSRTMRAIIANILEETDQEKRLRQS